MTTRKKQSAIAGATALAAAAVWMLVAPAGPEIELPGGGELVARQIAHRADGLNAYAYPAAGGMRVALFRDAGGLITFDLPDHFFGLGCAVAFAGDNLLIVGSNPDFGTVLDFTVSADWPPVITENATYSTDYDSTYSIRWPWACGLKSGGFVATWYLQRMDGLHARVAYRSAAGDWTEADVDLMGYSVSSQTAGNCIVVQHPADDSVWICGVKDSWGVLTAARLNEVQLRAAAPPAPTVTIRPISGGNVELSWPAQPGMRYAVESKTVAGWQTRAVTANSNAVFAAVSPLEVFRVRQSVGTELVFSDNLMIAHGWPHNGVVDPCAFDGELPTHFRVVPEGDKLRVLGNGYGFMVLPVQGFLKLDRLVSYTVTASGLKSVPTLTSNWTERVTPDYAWANGQVFMYPVATNASMWPSSYDMPLVRDGSGTLAVIERWLPLAAGDGWLAYQRGSDGKAVLRKL